MGIGWILKFIFMSHSFILKVGGLNFELLEHMVIIHLRMPRSILVHAIFIKFSIGIERMLVCWLEQLGRLHRL